MVGDNARNRDVEDVQDLKVAGDDHAFLTLGEAAGTEAALHNELVGAPVERVVHDHPGEDHGKGHEVILVADGIQFVGLGGEHGGDATKKTAVTHRANAEDKDQQTAGEQTDAVEGVGNGHALEAAKQRIGAADEAQHSDQNPHTGFFINAEQHRHVEQIHDRDGAAVERHRHPAEDIAEKEQGGHEPPRAGSIALFQKLRHGREAALEKRRQ